MGKSQGFSIECASGLAEKKSAMKERVSAVICAHNEQEYIETCLESIIAQTLKPSQVTVILDRCTDDTPQIVSKYSFQVIEKPSKNWENSYAEALEIGRQNSHGDYYAIVDADVELDRDYFEKTVSRFDEKTVGVSGRMVTASPGFLAKLIRLWERTYYYSPFKTSLPAGCGLLIKKRFLDEIGGFKDLPSPDTYVHQRALEQGLRFAIVKETTVRHNRKLSLRRVVDTQIEYGRRRRKLGIPFWKTFLHAALRVRPFVLYGWFKDGTSK